MGQTGGVGYTGSWWLGRVVPPLGLDLGFSPAQPQSSITSCEGQGFQPTPPATTQPRLWPVQHGRRDREGLMRQHQSLEMG